MYSVCAACNSMYNVWVCDTVCAIGGYSSILNSRALMNTWVHTSIYVYERVPYALSLLCCSFKFYGKAKKPATI